MEVSLSKSLLSEGSDTPLDTRREYDRIHKGAGGECKPINLWASGLPETARLILGILFNDTVRQSFFVLMPVKSASRRW